MGTIKGENIDLFDGYMIIQKVEATATVENATREQGQPNPDFRLLFDGLVNDETVPVWLEEPVFSCEATEESPVGEYPITVTAQAESYKLTFVAGVLTVTESTTGIADVRSQMSEVRGAYYNLAGQRVAQPGKGLYIRNGKKYLK
jgi:hypothetical protein